MEQYKISQVITGHMGYTHYQAHKGIMDICVGRKEVSLGERLQSRQDFLFPQIKDSYILQSCAGLGDRGYLQTAGVSQCQSTGRTGSCGWQQGQTARAHPTVSKHRVGSRDQLGAQITRKAYGNETSPRSRQAGSLQVRVRSGEDNHGQAQPSAMG